MLKLARLVLRLAVIYLVLGLCLFFGITQGFGIAPVEIAQEVIIISVAFYSFTLVELAVTTQLSHKDSSYFIGANLGFSLLRLFLTCLPGTEVYEAYGCPHVIYRPVTVHPLQPEGLEQALQLVGVEARGQ